ncbi:MAG: hypothetical protein ACHP9Z_28675, partial [Streptosporangiales bacterium]
AMLAMTRTAYVHGMDVMLAVCAVIAIGSAVLALAFLPGRSRTAVTAGQEASRSRRLRGA